MSDELPSEPEKSGTPGLAVLWLVLAFVPSVIALATSNRPGIGPVVLGVGILCCLIGGLGVAGAFKKSSSASSVLVGLLLAGVFFVLNVIIVVLIGCSGMGRIAP